MDEGCVKRAQAAVRQRLIGLFSGADWIACGYILQRYIQHWLSIRAASGKERGAPQSPKL